ncbi:MAG: hypothetical protein AAGD96_16125, partial [Chloroflexota bacterium]
MYKALNSERFYLKKIVILSAISIFLVAFGTQTLEAFPENKILSTVSADNIEDIAFSTDGETVFFRSFDIEDRIPGPTIVNEKVNILSTDGSQPIQQIDGTDYKIINNDQILVLRSCELVFFTVSTAQQTKIDQCYGSLYASLEV